MLKFFFFTDDIRVRYSEFGNTYEHLFEKTTNPENVPFSNVYFSTVSDLNNHAYNIQKQFGDKYKESIKVIDTERVMSHETFPVDIGFKENLDVALEPFKDHQTPFKVAIVNAMSNAIGDHLIGMRAFDVWLKRVEDHLELPVEVTFFQLNPMRMGPITAQRPQLKNIYILPNKLPRLTYHDAYIDLSSLLLRDNFDTQPMVDFFLEALSIPTNTVADEDKRIKFSYSPESVVQIEHIMKVIKTKNRPILMFHHKSTSAVREMTPIRARQILQEIINKSDYFVISAVDLEFQHERYLNISRFSKASLFHFAAIIDKVDAVLTVDTSTYHFADAFDTPTVALFTTINPDFRVRYYPLTEAVMLENEGGEIYGLHKSHIEPERLEPQVAYTDSLWAKLDIDDVLKRLDRVIQKKEDENYERCDFSRRVRYETVALDECDEQVPVAGLQQADDILPDTDLG